MYLGIGTTPLAGVVGVAILDRAAGTRNRDSERLVAGADQQGAGLALGDTAVEQLPVEAHGAERPPASGAELEIRLGRRLAPRALRDLDQPAGLQSAVGERVHVTLGVVPVHV